MFIGVAAGEVQPCIRHRAGLPRVRINWHGRFIEHFRLIHPMGWRMVFVFWERNRQIRSFYFFICECNMPHLLLLLLSG